MTFTVVIFTAACDDGNPAPPEMAAPPQQHIEKDDLSLLGIDEDHDGVRDDVQHYIDARYPHSHRVRMAMYARVRTLQAILLVPMKNTPAALAAQQRDRRALQCVFYLLPGEEGHKGAADLFDQYVNIPVRQKRYGRYVRQIDTLDPPEPDAAACDFNLKNLRN